VGSVAKYILSKRLAGADVAPMEETVFAQLVDGPLGEHHWLMDIGLVQARNTLGSSEAVNTYIQEAIEEAQGLAELPMIFVSQHDKSPEFEFGDRCIVFSANACADQLSVPLLAMNYGYLRKARRRRFGFLGQLYMHPIRPRLQSLYPEQVRQSALRGWDPSNPAEGRRFIDDLNDLEFALCPRGNGLATLRIYEAMGSGAVPVIIADGYRKPLSWMLDWDSFSVTVPYSEITRIPEILGSYSARAVSSMRASALEAFELYFSPTMMHRVVEIEMKEVAAREGAARQARPTWQSPVVTFARSSAGGEIPGAEQGSRGALEPGPQ